MWTVSRFLHRDPKWHEAIRVVHAQVDRYIDNAFRQQASKGPGAEGDASSTEDEENRHILLHEMAKETQDRPDLRSQILTVFMPGRDSTGYALSNVFHVLARRPDIYEKLRSEVLGAGSEPLTFEHLKSLKYVQWVLNEGTSPHPHAVSIQGSDLCRAHRSSRISNHHAGTARLPTGHNSANRRRRGRPGAHLHAQRRSSDGWHVGPPPG